MHQIALAKYSKNYNVGVYISLYKNFFLNEWEKTFCDFHPTEQNEKRDGGKKSDFTSTQNIYG